MKQAASVTTDRTIAVVADSLEVQADSHSLPREAYQSRTAFYRVFRALADEPPVAMRRRLLLERAAWRLGRSQAKIAEIAAEAQYGSLEAFTRAFRKAFGVSPSFYRRMGATEYRLGSPKGIHFAAPGSTTVTKGTFEMDLFDRFLGHDTWQTRRLLEWASKLSDEQLDAAIPGYTKPLPWDPPSETLRGVLFRIVQTKEVWTAALAGKDFPAPVETDSPCQLLARYNQADAEFTAILQEVRDRGGWDDVFIDALCEPAETFTFGGMFAHIMNFNAYRRFVAETALRSFGIEVPGFGCPTEFEQMVQPWKPIEALAR